MRSREAIRVIDVFILGAGFSIAVDELAFPSTNDLGVGALEIPKSWHRVPDRLHSSICDGVSCDDPVLIHGHIPTEDQNFETWLSRLAEAQPFLLNFENARNAALFEQLTIAISTALEFAVARAFEAEAPEWLTSLVKAWHHREADILTFNYDPVIEATVDCAGLDDPDSDVHKVAFEQLGPTMTLIPAWNVLTGGVPVRSLRLFKMHGSLTWYWDERTRSPESMIDVGLQQRWGGATDGSPDCSVRAPGRVPVIVPPTFSKNPFLDNRVIRTIWRKGFEALRIADRVFVIGYSLPPADLLVRSMLTDAFRAKSKEVWIVDRNVDISDRFGGLGASRVDTTFCGQSGAVRAFAEWYTGPPP